MKDFSLIIDSLSACGTATDGVCNLIEMIRTRKKAWTAQQLGELLAMSSKHILKLAKDQRMPSYRLGGAVRFDPAATANWLEKKSVG